MYHRYNLSQVLGVFQELGCKKNSSTLSSTQCVHCHKPIATLNIYIW